MTQERKKTKYKQFTSYERDVLATLWAQGLSMRTIAKQLERNVSTISRELYRNSPYVFKYEKDYYLSSRAQKRCEERRSVSHKKDRLKNKIIKEYVINKLMIGWSPELIAGRLSFELPRQRISHEAIYQWIYCEAREFIACLLRKRKHRKKRGSPTKHVKCRIPARVGIEERPLEIQLRHEIGHWEIDTASSTSHNTASLHVMIERKSRYVLLTKLAKKNSLEVRDATLKRMKFIPKHLRKSFTYDNGSENIRHVWVNHVLNTKSYFCQPYQSWQKGSVENAIGIVRRFFPKNTNFGEIRPDDVKIVEKWMNNRPRKCLQFQTPAEVFNKERCA